MKKLINLLAIFLIALGAFYIGFEISHLLTDAKVVDETVITQVPKSFPIPPLTGIWCILVGTLILIINKYSTS
jgi:hypothetical protein